ncbi:MAG: hypothetical protein WCF78_02140 [archaeon]
MPTRPPIKKPIFISRSKGKNKLSIKTLTNIDERLLSREEAIGNKKRFLEEKLNKELNVNSNKITAHLDEITYQKHKMDVSLNNLLDTGLKDLDSNRNPKEILDLFERIKKQRAISNQYQKILDEINSKLKIEKESFNTKQKALNVSSIKERENLKKKFLLLEKRLEAYNFRKGIYKRK